jgi:hypothetical protein
MKEQNDFYIMIEKKHQQLIDELMQKDCQKVEFIRGMLSVYSEILQHKKHWQPETRSYFK